jgi:hypothetical protein
MGPCGFLLQEDVAIDIADSCLAYIAYVKDILLLLSTTTIQACM